MLERAVVHDTRDPQKKGRLRVRIPNKTGQEVTGWIWPVVTSGFLVLPSPGDQVWVTYESGDEDFPVWLGRIAVAKTYREDNTNLGNVSLLLKRVKDLEKDVSDLQEAVSDLESAVAQLQTGKANVGHSHG